jgi:hypothetical protein
MARLERLETTGIITAATFAACLRCPTKALLLARKPKGAQICAPLSTMSAESAARSKQRLRKFAQPSVGALNETAAQNALKVIRRLVARVS